MREEESSRLLGVVVEANRELRRLIYPSSKMNASPEEKHRVSDHIQSDLFFTEAERHLEFQPCPAGIVRNYRKEGLFLVLGYANPALYDKLNLSPKQVLRRKYASFFEGPPEVIEAFFRGEEVKTVRAIVTDGRNRKQEYVITEVVHRVPLPEEDAEKDEVGNLVYTEFYMEPIHFLKAKERRIPKIGPPKKNVA